MKKKYWKLEKKGTGMCNITLNDLIAKESKKKNRLLSFQIRIDSPFSFFG